MPGPESRDREGRLPNTLLLPPGDGFRSDGQASGGNLDHKPKEPLPDAIGIKQTDRGACGLYRTLGELERARRNRCVDGSPAANLRPGATPDPTRRGTR